MTEPIRTSEQSAEQSAGTFNASAVIIHGVDVSGCKYFEKGICSCIDVRNCEGHIDLLITDCKDNPNCCHKQLQRKAAECEKLKQRLITLDEEAETVELTLDEFEEYKQLKSKLQIATEALEKIQYYYNYEDSSSNVWDMTKIAEQALERIKE